MSKTVALVPGDFSINTRGRRLAVGELCPYSALTMAAALDFLVDAGPVGTDLLVDVSGLDLCTADGIEVLHAARRRLEGRGDALRLHGARGAVATVLDMAGLVRGAS